LRQFGLHCFQLFERQFKLGNPGVELFRGSAKLRKDSTFSVLAGKLKPVLRSDCEALAGKSTLNRLEHTPKRHAAKYHKIDCDGTRVEWGVTPAEAILGRRTPAPMSYPDASDTAKQTERLLHPF
jgi:hypothetical protein